MGWIYIAHDTHKQRQCKVGKTTRAPYVRVSETENPDYELFHAWEVSDDALDQIEKDLHQQLAQRHKRILHRSSGRPSEHFECDAQEAQHFIEELLLKRDTNIKRQAEKEIAKQGVRKQRKLDNIQHQQVWEQMEITERHRHLVASFAFIDYCSLRTTIYERVKLCEEKTKQQQMTRTVMYKIKVLAVSLLVTPIITLFTFAAVIIIEGLFGLGRFDYNIILIIGGSLACIVGFSYLKKYFTYSEEEEKIDKKIQLIDEQIKNLRTEIDKKALSKINDSSKPNKLQMTLLNDEKYELVQ